MLGKKENNLKKWTEYFLFQILFCSCLKICEMFIQPNF